jgi:hypothetical protein
VRRRCLIAASRLPGLSKSTQCLLHREARDWRKTIFLAAGAAKGPSIFYRTASRRFGARPRRLRGFPRVRSSPYLKSRFSIAARRRPRFGSVLDMPGVKKVATCDSFFLPCGRSPHRANSCSISGAREGAIRRLRLVSRHQRNGRSLLAMCLLGQFCNLPIVALTIGNIGAPEGIRTPDLCLRRAALYPAELRARSGVDSESPAIRQCPPLAAGYAPF